MLCAYGDMLEAFGPRAEDREDRRHGLEVWIVSGSQIGLSSMRIRVRLTYADKLSNFPSPGTRLARLQILAEFEAIRGSQSSQ